MKFILPMSFFLFFSVASASTMVCNVTDDGQLKLTSTMDLDENGDCDLEIGKYDKYDFFAFARDSYVFAIGGSSPIEELNRSNVAMAFKSSTGSIIIVDCKI